jgi:hypothetical protein
MTYAEANFLPRETQKLALTRNLGDAFAAVAAHLWPHNTAKLAETEWSLDRSTAKNVVKGVAGGVVVTRALHAQQRKHRNAWGLWLALGELIIGEPLEAFEQRELARIQEEAANARDRQAARAERRKAVVEGAAALVAVRNRPGAERLGRVDGRAGASSHGMVARAAVSEVKRAGEAKSFAPQKRNGGRK